ncbi:hypothetical protein QJS04_geneDACA023895 [Acorus gramineus]|uniref:Uncharacterized protein n=1 Tax=Acorus gramineus TaxID=55184 RepID=A0AAV8ZYS3_ACOGR|nr:hypothetical protein QJS04_geneDACA023895 [Acorus gramineus]
MASYSSTFYIFLQIFLLAALSQSSLASRKLSELVKEESPLMQYHNGSLLNGPITVNLIWYGRFTPSQRAILSDFVASLSSTQPQSSPSVSSWWKTTEKYYKNNHHRLSLTVGRQILNEGYSFGKSLSTQKIERLAAMGDPRNAINVVLTSDDVTVDGFCMSRCGTHGASPPAKKGRFAYVWVGNSASQCPGQCAWPFHQPIYGPQSPPLVSPNGDVGVDGMVMNLASLLAGTVTNPFGDGYFQGPTEAPLEAASACPGMYGKNAYPGYAGDLLVDPTTGASYNANGEIGRKYLLPALFDPTTSSCSTLV